MNNPTVLSPRIHYHIRWLASGELDWERHDTCIEAKEAAEQLSRRNERYVVERFDESCAKCANISVECKKLGAKSAANL